MLTQNTIAFRKGMILTPSHTAKVENGTSSCHSTQETFNRGQQIVATLQAELMQLGYMLDSAAFGAVHNSPEEFQIAYYNEIISYLKKTLGADRSYTPFYRNFPQQVMDMTHMELFLNAIIHYWSNGRWEPPQSLVERGVKFENTAFKQIKLATPEQFKGIFTQMVGVNTSLTEDDKAIVGWFIDTYGKDGLTLPPSIPFKETLCILAAKKFDVPVKVTTDVLRVAVYLSGGDISLPNVPKVSEPPSKLAYSWRIAQAVASRAEARKAFLFRKFTRSERRYIVGLLAKTNLDVADMQRHKGRWIRLGERLHVGEFVSKYPKVVEAFRQMREQPTGKPSVFTAQPRSHVRSFNSNVDMAFQSSFAEGVKFLATHPGEFARRLDWMLRPEKPKASVVQKTGNTVISNELASQLQNALKDRAHIDPDAPNADEGAAALSPSERVSLVLDTFYRIGHNISGKVLFEMYSHFQNRLKDGAPRVIRLKSKRAKAKTLPPLAALAPEIVAQVQTHIMSIIHDKTCALAPMGKVWVDERLKDVPLPYSMRSVNTSIRTYVRGTRIPFREDAKVIRPFIHWYDENGSEDLDLSVGLYRSNLSHAGHISFTHLKEYGCCHSGDIRHRRGACAEYVDIPLDVTSKGVRYAVVQVHNFNGRPMHTIKDCVFGLMEREHAKANEIFVPKTISNCMGISNEGTTVVVCIIDLEKKCYIWADTEMEGTIPTLESTSTGTGQLLHSLIVGAKMSVYDLLKVHAESRGTLVAEREKSDLQIGWEEMATDYTKVAQYMNV